MKKFLVIALLSIIFIIPAGGWPWFLPVSEAADNMPALAAGSGFSLYLSKEGKVYARGDNRHCSFGVSGISKNLAIRNNQDVLEWVITDMN